MNKNRKDGFLGNFVKITMLAVISVIFMGFLIKSGDCQSGHRRQSSHRRMQPLEGTEKFPLVFEALMSAGECSEMGGQMEADSEMADEGSSKEKLQRDSELGKSKEKIIPGTVGTTPKPKLHSEGNAAIVDVKIRIRSKGSVKFTESESVREGKMNAKATKAKIVTRNKSWKI